MSVIYCSSMQHHDINRVLRQGSGSSLAAAPRRARQAVRHRLAHAVPQGLPLRWRRARYVPARSEAAIITIWLKSYIKRQE